MTARSATPPTAAPMAMYLTEEEDFALAGVEVGVGGGVYLIDTKVCQSQAGTPWRVRERLTRIYRARIHSGKRDRRR